jgi:hypothetical protein
METVVTRHLFGSVLLVALAGAGTAQGIVVLGNGDSVNLAALIGPNSDRVFCVGDKLFTLESVTTTSFNPADFTIIGFIAGTPGLLPNIGFDITGPFGDGSPGDMSVHEFNIQYSVEVKPEFFAQGIRIKDASLTFNGSSSGDGSFARVDETIFDFDTNTLLNQLSVFDIAGPPQVTRLQDSIDYLPNSYRKLEVNKDMKFFAAHVNDTATASFIRQEFSQIPTPGAISLLAVAGMAAGRRRRV